MTQNVAASADIGVVRKKRLAKMKKLRSNRAAWAEIKQMAKDGGTPSRKQWNKWGLDPEEGLTKQLRKEWIKEMVEGAESLTVENMTYQQKPSQQGQAAEPGSSADSTFLERWESPGGTAEVQGYDAKRGKYWVKTGDSSQLRLLTAEEVAQTKADDTANVAAREKLRQGKAVRPEVMTDTQVDVRQDRVVPRMEMQAKGTGEVIGKREVVRELDKIWGNVTREGRLRSRGALGEFHTKSWVSRLKGGTEDNFETVVHETAHYMDASTDILKNAPADAKAEVSRLDYSYPKQARDFEGFAEFIRGYTTGSADVQAMAPSFHAYMESYLKSHPDVAEKFAKSKALIERLDKAGSVGRTKGQISKTGKDKNAGIEVKRVITDAANFLYRKFKDQTEAAKRFSDESLARGWKRERNGENRRTAHELQVALRQAGPHMAARALEDGVFKLTGQQDKIGPSIREVLSEIGDDEDYANFLAWAYARHARETWRKTGKNPGISRKDAEVTYRELHDSRYERVADKLTEFNNALIDVLSDAGVIDGKTAKKIKGAYEHYIPLQRARKSIFKRASSGKMVDVGAAVKGRKGSGLQIIDPVQATLSRAVQMYERAATQLVVQRIHEQATETEGMGPWYEEVKPKVAAAHFKFEEIRGQLAKSMASEGFDSDIVEELLDTIGDAAAFDTLTIFRPDYMSKDGKPIFRVNMRGKPKLVQLDEALAESLGALHSQVDLDFVTEAARAMTSAVKFGATRANPSFILTNAARDYQTFLMQGEKGLSGAVDPATYAMAYIASELERQAGGKGKPLVRLFQQMGGELSTYVGLDRGRLKGGVKRLRKGKQGKFETAVNIAGTSEVAGRISEFACILDKKGWLKRVEAGETPPLEVLVEAINAAHDVTVDFRRLGTWGRKLNYYIPFINAQMEGLDKTIRTFKDHPARTLARVTMQRLPLALLYWWLRHDDDDYKERPEWQDGYYIINDTKGNPYLRIPKSHEWGLIDSGIERMLDAMYDKDPAAIKRWLKQVGKTTMPNTNPAGFTTVAETFFNYDMFRERPIVSEAISGLEGKDQYYDYTTSLAKGVAKLLHDISGGSVSLSPAKIDHLANGMTGGLYGRAAAVGGKVASGESWRVNDVPGLKGITLRKEYTKSIDDFYTVRERLNREHESAKLRNPDHKTSKERQAYQYAGELMTEMRKAARNLTGDDREKVDASLTGLARAVMGKPPLDRYRNPFLASDDLPKTVQAAVDKHIAAKISTAAREKNSDSVANAVHYLKLMGVRGNRKKVYASLRKRKRSVKSAEKGAWKLARRLK